jgi:site-specific DNA-methyltransferase (cytosine-N4-specific)
MTETDQPGHPTLTGGWNGTMPRQSEECNPLNYPATDPGEILPAFESNSVTNMKSGSIAHISRILAQPNAILCGDALRVLRTLPDDYFSCCITSPPYWDTRNSGRGDILGYEEDYRDYIRTLVQVFREVRRTLTPSGTFWLVIGDTYASDDRRWWALFNGFPPRDPDFYPVLPEGFKSKDLMGIPWRLAIELQNDGWYLRSDIVWSIPNHRSEPVRDRPARGHDYVFLFAKSEQYAYHGSCGRTMFPGTVWEIPTTRNSPIHYDVFPETLVERCMQAGTRKDDVVLDPFFGSGTVGIVAKRLNRRYVGIDLNPTYVTLAGKRIREAG